MPEDFLLPAASNIDDHPDWADGDLVLANIRDVWTLGLVVRKNCVQSKRRQKYLVR